MATCRCGKQLSGGLDTYGTVDNPLCQDCWFETGELRLVRFREKAESDMECRSIERDIRYKRAEIKDMHDEIEELEGQLSVLESELEELETQLDEERENALVSWNLAVS